MGKLSADPDVRFSTAQALCIAAVIFAGILTFPFEALPLGSPGIDSGWQWVVNIAADHDWIFGQDVVFTYGPLGWLASPQDVGHHLLLANGFRAALQAALIISVLMLLTSSGRPASVLVFAALWIVAGAVGLRFEGFVFLVVAVLMIVAVKSGRWWPAITAGLITGVALFIKTSLGIGTAVTIVVGAALIWKHRGFRVPLGMAVAVAATVALLASLLFSSLSAFGAWISQSLEVVDGYAAVASIVGPKSALVVAAMMLLGTIIVGAFLTLKTPSFASTTLVLAPSLLVTFRLAFVRQDGHQNLFVPFLVALLGVAALGASRRLAQVLLVAGLGIVTLATFSGLVPFSAKSLPRVVSLGHRGPRNIQQFIRLNHTRKQLAESSERNLEPLKLPPAWTDILSQAPHGITVVPWELMYAPANNLLLQPLRTMQLYSAYTANLDQITANGLSGPDAPEFVLDDFAPVGTRRALLDVPATWRTLFLGYRLEKSAQDRPLLLLSRRSKPLEYQWEDLSTSTLEVGGPGINVPSSTHMVFAEIDAPLNLLGRLNKAFFRVPLLMAIFHRIDGTSSWTRLIPATAPAGILISHYPHDIDDYAGLWSGRLPVEVSRLQVTGPGTKYYVKNLTVRWRALDIESPRIY